MKGDVLLLGGGGHCLDALEAYSTMDFVNFPKAKFAIPGTIPVAVAAIRAIATSHLSHLVE